MNSTVSCSIILPCYNPQPGWVGRVVEQYATTTKQLNVQLTLILVNDGSTTNVSDRDIAFLQEKISLFKYITYSDNKGKGYAVRQGVAAAEADYFIYTDIDFPYTIDSLHTIFNALYKNGYDVALGIKNEAYYKQVPAVRRYISKWLRRMIGLFLRIPITDTQCGLKGFKKSVQEDFVSIDIDSYLFDLEFVRKVYKKKIHKIISVPVELNQDVVFRKMSYKLLLPEMINFIKIALRK